MALYMVQFAYTPEAWTGFTKHPEDRTAAVQKLAQNLGCRFETQIAAGAHRFDEAEINQFLDDFLRRHASQAGW